MTRRISQRQGLAEAMYCRKFSARPCLALLLWLKTLDKIDRNLMGSSQKGHMLFYFQALLVLNFKGVLPLLSVALSRFWEIPPRVATGISENFFTQVKQIMV